MKNYEKTRKPKTLYKWLWAKVTIVFKKYMHRMHGKVFVSDVHKNALGCKIASLLYRATVWSEKISRSECFPKQYRVCADYQFQSSLESPIMKKVKKKLKQTQLFIKVGQLRPARKWKFWTARYILWIQWNGHRLLCWGN